MWMQNEMDEPGQGNADCQKVFNRLKIKKKKKSNPGEVLWLIIKIQNMNAETVVNINSYKKCNSNTKDRITFNDAGNMI